VNAPETPDQPSPSPTAPNPAGPQVESGDGTSATAPGVAQTLGGLFKIIQSFRSRNRITRGERNLRALLWAVTPALDLQILGRTLLHAASVGVAAGLVGAAFFAGLEYAQALFLQRLAGFAPLRAHGEHITNAVAAPTLHYWLIALLPALGALAAGIITQLAPEARGGGGDATIEAFHQRGGFIRARVIWVKAVASMLTLGSGGSGGREGPTMLVGGALGSTLGRLLRVSPREQRVLMVAGVAAGLAAVFRTPLGAALLAAEVLYREDFEAEVLVPAVLASVVAYSVVIALFGESVLFAHAPRYPFVIAHLPLYALLAVLVCVVASLFLRTLRAVQARSATLRVPSWARPAIGGLALGLFAVPLIWFVGGHFGTPGRSLGILGGGYGAAQIAITGADWLPVGWKGVEFLLFLCGAKIIATSLTIGSGGSAGDFGPSLVLGGLFGGAFGRAAALMLGDPRIDPGAFALVGMGTFYGGLAHVPLASLILVSELAGSYDLLVPSMLAQGIAFVALRRRSLYEAQVPTRKDSPVYESSAVLEVLAPSRVIDVATLGRELRRFELSTIMSEVVRVVAEVPGQNTFPVMNDAGRMAGLITADAVLALRSDRDLHGLAVAADLMQAPASVTTEFDLQRAAELMLSSGLKQIPIVDGDGKLLGVLEEGDVARAYVRAMTAPRSGDPPSSA
jgi:CIC family chloride channel protein